MRLADRRPGGAAWRAASPPLLAGVLAAALAAPAAAANFNVDNDASLRAAIVDAASGDTITFTASVALRADLPAVQTSVTILGSGYTLSGGDQYRGLLVGAFAGAAAVPVAVSIRNLTIANTTARGGDAGTSPGAGGGGGAGLGGALFVASQASVTLTGVSLTGDRAIGGTGTIGPAGGGGGMGGTGGAGGGVPGGGGGLGMGADGGSATTPALPGIATAAAPGGSGGGAGAAAGGGGGAGAAGGGGGGGGVGGAAGAAATQQGGQGGFGGGGGGGVQQGGAGGFGGGGGAGAFGGAGGFGGGGGGGGVLAGGGGFAGGAGGTGTLLGGGDGGGGGGLGGAIFVQAGGSLTVAGALDLAGNTVAGGLAQHATAGGAYGGGIFVQGTPGTTTVLGFGTGTQNLADVIADYSGAGGTNPSGGNDPADQGGRLALAKSGGGTLTLGATNSYSGGTTITGGRIAFTSAANFGSGPIALDGGGLQWASGTATDISARLAPIGAAGGVFDTNASDVAFATGLSGTGGITKAGAGALILDGSNTLSGTSTVAAGTLEIGDASHPGASLAGGVRVDAGGTLAGDGTVGLGVVNAAGGIVAPGAGIGTLGVGSYTQQPGGTLAIAVSPGAASLLAVAGGARLAGTLRLVYEPGVYSEKTYTIVTAAAVAGRFATLAGGAPAGFVPALGYGATAVDLTLAPASATPLVVAPGADSVFADLTAAALAAGQDANATLLASLAAPGAAPIDIATSPAPPAATRLAFAGSDLSPFLAALPRRMAALGGWFHATGTFASVNGGAVAGFDTQSGGFLAGLDRPVAAHLRLGLAVGYTHTDLAVHDGESGTIDTPRLMLYAVRDAGRWALDATLGYGLDRVRAARALAAAGAIASSSHDTQEATAAMQARTAIPLAGGVLVPAIGLDYVHLFAPGFDETGAPGFNLAVAGGDADSLRPFLRLALRQSFVAASGTVWTPQADITYSHELFAATPSLVAIGGGSFTVDRLATPRDQLTIGGSIAARLGARLALDLSYHATLPTGNLLVQSLAAGLTYAF